MKLYTEDQMADYALMQMDHCRKAMGYCDETNLQKMPQPYAETIEKGFLLEDLDIKIIKLCKSKSEVTVTVAPSHCGLDPSDTIIRISKPKPAPIRKGELIRYKKECSSTWKRSWADCDMVVGSFHTSRGISKHTNHYFAVEVQRNGEWVKL